MIFNIYSSEGFQDKNNTASICRANPNSINELKSKIETCTTQVELDRNTNLINNTFKLQTDIENLSGIVTDSLTMGDSMFGQFGHKDITTHIKERNIELKTKKYTIVKEIEKSEATIERSNRDFSDVNDTINKPQTKKILHFIEDYTLAILSISYIFMIISVIYMHTLNSSTKILGFIQSLTGSIFLSIFLFMILYYLG